jgi:ribose transport system substrate-binding protein
MCAKTWPSALIFVFVAVAAAVGAVGVLGVLGGCDEESASSGSGAGPAPADTSLTIAVIPKSTGGEFWETVRAGAQQAASELGVEMRWEGTLAETEIAEQNKIIENMTNLGVDGMVLAPLNARAMRKGVENTVAAGIPVVIFDSAVEGEAHTSFVATNNRKGGTLAAEEMGRLLGELTGKKLLVLRYIQGTASTEERSEGFIETARRGGAQIAGDPYPADGTVAGAKKTAANTLESYVRDGRLELDGIFAANLYTTLGMLDALADLRKSGVRVDAKFVGFDTSPKLIEALQAEEVHALISQNPRKMGYLAVETMVKHLRGEKVEAAVDTGVEVVTSERLADPQIRKLVGLE